MNGRGSTVYPDARYGDPRDASMWDPNAQSEPSPFLLTMATPYYHPQHRNLYVQLLGDSLFVTNIPPHDHNEYFVVREFPRGQWFNLRDKHGRQMPVSLLVTNTGELYGCWILESTR
jgi:hypothetical protein